MSARVEIQPAGEIWIVGEERLCGCVVEFVDVACELHSDLLDRARFFCPDCQFGLLGVLHGCGGGES
jgi:hypothetical protein